MISMISAIPMVDSKLPMLSMKPEKVFNAFTSLYKGRLAIILILVTIL